MQRSGLLILSASGVLCALVATHAAPQSSPPPDLATLESLAAEPAKLSDRDVRLKIFKALNAPSPDVVAAAVEIVMSSPDLTTDPQLWRRFNAALSGADPARRKAVLDRAAKRRAFADHRILAVIVEALTDDDAALRAAASEIVKSDAALQRNPAIAEALARTGGGDPAVLLPSLEAFKSRVQPVLETIGPDKKRCSSCHEEHSVFRLPPMDASQSAADVLQTRYRTALRVVDLEDPERSLILRKPISPKRDASLTHGGDVRFEANSESYQAILAWIKTGGSRR